MRLHGVKALSRGLCIAEPSYVQNKILHWGSIKQVRAIMYFWPNRHHDQSSLANQLTDFLNTISNAKLEQAL